MWRYHWESIWTALKWLGLLSGLVMLSGCPAAVKPGGGAGKAGAGFERSMTSGKAALVGNQVEEPGYGLYTYVMLGSPPNQSNRDRYLHVLSVFVTAIPDMKGLEDKGFERRQLNITYVLLQEAPPPEVLRRAVGTPDQITAFADWALGHYDYGRARSMLGSLPDTHGDGPYLISTLQPFGASQGARAGYLYQDLSSVEPRCVSFWFGEFLDRASRPGTWDRASADELARKLREVLASAATPCAGGGEALQRWVRWTHAG